MKHRTEIYRTRKVDFLCVSSVSSVSYPILINNYLVFCLFPLFQHLRAVYQFHKKFILLVACSISYHDTLRDALIEKHYLCPFTDNYADSVDATGIYIEQYTHNDDTMTKWNFDEMETDYECECIEYTRTI